MSIQGSIIDLDIDQTSKGFERARAQDQRIVCQYIDNRIYHSFVQSYILLTPLFQKYKGVGYYTEKTSAMINLGIFRSKTHLRLQVKAQTSSHHLIRVPQSHFPLSIPLTNEYPL